MITRTAITLFCTLFFVGDAFAEGTVDFSAGEHADHSRIVISGSDTELNVTQSGRDIEIHFRSVIDKFNLADVNIFRKAHRVLKADEASVASGSLVRLQLNCDCQVKTMQLEDGDWTLDIFDSVQKQKLVEKTKPVPQKKSESTLKDNKQKQRNDEDVDTLSVDQAHTRMVDLLQQAADEGLIVIKSKTEETADPSTGDDSRSVFEEIATIAIDKDEHIESVSQAPPKVLAPGACLPDDDFAIDGERFEKNPLVEIAELQSNIIDASAEQQREVIEKLAGGFLAIGFGEEALALLTDSGLEGILLADMARTVAEKPIQASGILLNAIECGGAHALWQAAASEPAVATEKFHRSSDAVTLLPKRLRALLGARIAQKMIDAGDWATANRLYEIAASASEIPTPKLQFVAARLREHEGATEESQDLLLDLAGSGSDAAKDALLMLAEQYAVGQGEPHVGFVDDLGALAKVQRGSDDGAQAAFMEALIWSEAGNVEASMLLLRSAANSSPAKAEKSRLKAREILTKAFSSPIEAERISALAAFMDHREFVESIDPSPTFQQNVARSALDLGLPNIAFDVLKDRALSSKKELMQLKALAALEGHNTEGALAMAAPYTNDPEFAELVVRANMQQRNYFAALAVASTLPNSSKKEILTSQSAWRAGDWESAERAFRRMDPSLMGENVAIQYAFAAYMSGVSVIPPAAEAVLRRTNSSALAGIKSLFSNALEGSILDRARTATMGATEEIELLEEALSHG